MKYIVNFCDKWYAFPIVLFLLGIYLLLGINQGFNMCDEPFTLLIYKNFNSFPELTQWSFYLYLTNLIGNFFHLIYPEGGVLYYRVLNVFCLLSSVTLSYFILKKYLSKYLIIIGLIFYIIVLFSSGEGVQNNGPLNYVGIPQFFTLLSLLFLMNGLKNVNSFFLLLAGTIIGINIFTRIPNITMVSLCLVIIVNAYFAKIPFKYWKKQLFWMITGIFIGILLIIGLQVVLGQEQLMLNGLKGLVYSFFDKSSAHSSTSLFSNYAKTYDDIISIICRLVFILLSAYLAFNIKNKFIRYFTYFLCVSLLLLSFNKLNNHHGYYAIGFIINSYLFVKSTNTLFKSLIIGNIIILVFLPIGSSDYWIMTSNCLSLTFPMIFLVAESFKSINLKIDNYHQSDIVFHTKVTKASIWFIMLLLLVSNVSKKVQTILESKNKYEVENIFMNHINVGKKRSVELNKLISAMSLYVKKDDYILTDIMLPSVYYFSDTKPCISTYWTAEFSDSRLTSELLKLQVSDKKPLPIVVIQRYHADYYFGSPIKDYPSNSIIKDFLKRNNYFSAWESEYFAIFKTKKMSF